MSVTSQSKTDDIVDFNEETALDPHSRDGQEHAEPEKPRCSSKRCCATWSVLFREARPTVEEWRAGLDFLKRTGQVSNEVRDEFGLLDGLLGTEMLVDANTACA